MKKLEQTIYSHQLKNTWLGLGNDISIQKFHASSCFLFWKTTTT